MLKIGGIYNANDLDDSVFIYLYKKMKFIMELIF